MKSITTLILTILFCSSGLFAQDQPYKSRWDKVLEKTEKDVIVIKNSGRDYVMAMNVNWNYYYLCGDVSEDAILLIDGKTKNGVIFRKEASYGRRDSAINGIEYKPIEEFETYLPRTVYGASSIWMDFSAMVNLENMGPRLQLAGEIKNISPVIHSLRKNKDEHEMDLLTHAIQTTADGLVEVMKAAEPGMNEKDFELILKYKFGKAGCENLGFNIQAASGPNSTFVHYGDNDRDTKEGDMMVFDVGARSGYYSADISRSFPVSGKFTKEQKEIYSLVLKAQKAAIEKMQPGVNIGIASAAATEILNQGLEDLGLITNPEKKWQQRFWIQHGFFHHIGLVVHDVGGYNMDLEPGMIITMEPGLYFPEDYLGTEGRNRFRGVSDEERDEFIKEVKPVFEKYINIGVRIEDDVYITNDGNRIISGSVPKEINDIENLMKQSSFFNK